MSIQPAVLQDESTFFGQLRAACQREWYSYCHHPFVQGIQDGTLSLAAFKHYLQQDYLFLIHFARAYALAVYKADNVDDMQAAADGMRGSIGELDLHLSYCEQWGLSKQAVQTIPEAPANVAYTRYVLERGMSGDILDLYVALSPCAVGYAEIGQRLINDPLTKKEGNLYWPWIETYGSAEFLEGAIKQIEQLDRLAQARLTPARMTSLIETFKQATVLEIGFWGMGLALNSTFADVDVE